MGADLKKGSSELIINEDGSLYHIGLKPGGVAPFIMLCGDVERVHKVAKLLEEPTEPVRSREYCTVTGRYKGVPVSVMATGMGPDNTEIALVELGQVVKNPTFIRVGTCGGISKNAKLGDMAISSGAVRLETTSTYFVSEGYPAVANHEVVIALLESASRVSRPHKLGITATACGFYGAEGRSVPGFPARYPNLPDELERMNVLNMEMEASTLFTLSSFAGFRAGAVCAVIAERHADSFITPEDKKNLELDCIKTALEAFVLLREMDKKRGEKSYWVPSMGL